MEHWNTSAVVLSSYYPAAFRDWGFAVIILPPLAFLINLQRKRKDIYKTYKTSVFRVCYTYAFITTPFIYLHMQLFFRSYFTSLSETTILWCTIFKGTLSFFALSFDAYLLADTIIRYLMIVWDIKLPYWCFICLFGIFGFKQWSYALSNPFIGVPTRNDSCSPLLSGSFLGGFLTTAMAMVAFNLSTCLLNLHILWFMTRHFKKSQGRQLSQLQEQDQKNLIKGLILNSFIPTITSSLSVYQMTLARQYEVPLIIINPLTFLARTTPFLQMTCPYIFLRSFREELLYFISFGKIKKEVPVVKVLSMNTF